ncbi:uncharacterized protein LOC113305451 [Papaver somniferum]|uniref:uncharacterized protein LOC113305451 n=1 Tax=Papaver somniferum TaxID=3469 RepID=UPI000E6F4F7D|nr:uncharacterized protein LOC113305451 [Papaver somniferum]
METAAAAETVNENYADVDAIMAKTLPKYVIIQSSQKDNSYLHLYKEHPSFCNALRFVGGYSFGLETRFELVPATTGAGLFHIRSLLNNKYWENFGTDNNWVSAMADKPVEDQSENRCTLFQPVFVHSNNNRVLRLRHVHTQKFVTFFHGTGDDCALLSLLTGDEGHDVCTFIDWESVVVLPDVIRIKSNNGNHLRGWRDDFMDYRGKADNTSRFDFEVSPSRDGGIRLKNIHFGTYWTDMNDSDWVLLRHPSPTVHDTNTVFLPTILGGNRIYMRSLANNRFCSRHTDPEWDRENCLATVNTWPDNCCNSCTMEIEEPVISRTISNVIYHLTDARLYNEKTLALITDDTCNETPLPQTSQISLKTTVCNTANWSNSVTLKLGVKVTGTHAVPDIKSGSLEISTEVTKSFEWGETETETQEVGSVRTITVPPMSRVKATLKGTRVSYDIPFSYTQRDVLINGTTKVSVKNDGLFTGKGGYDYKHEIVQLAL